MRRAFQKETHILSPKVNATSHLFSLRDNLFNNSLSCFPCNKRSTVYTVYIAKHTNFEPVYIGFYTYVFMYCMYHVASQRLDHGYEPGTSALQSSTLPLSHLAL